MKMAKGGNESSLEMRKKEVLHSFKTLSHDNLHSSDDASVHTLESSVSFIASDHDTGKDQSYCRSMYQFQDRKAMEFVQRDEIESLSAEEHYNVYRYPEVTFSISDGAAVSTDSSGSYDAYLTGVRHSAISKSSSEEEFNDSRDDDEFAHAMATYTREDASMTRQSGDDDGGFGNCFCMNIFGRNANEGDSDSDGESVMTDTNGKRQVKRNTEANTKERSRRKAKLNAKLASMDPKAARAFKKKLLQEKMSKKRDGKGKNNVSEDLLKMQDEYVKQQLLKKKQKQHQRREKERRDRSESDTGETKERQQQIEEEAEVVPPKKSNFFRRRHTKIR